LSKIIISSIYIMARSRAYVFTINNYTEEDIEKIKELNVKYLIIGDEVGRENGTPHLQGYVSLEYQMTLSALKKYIPRGHIEKAKGNAYQNYEYCSKENILIEEGERPKQGRRTDLESIKEYIDETPNPSMEGVIEIATSYQSVKMAEQPNLTLRK